jgi:threonyl-tRNA synthetase
MPELSDYALAVNRRLVDEGLRSHADLSDARLAAKVRTAVTRKVPLIVVVGRREADDGTVTVRDRSGQETTMPLDEFVAHTLQVVRSKSLEGAGHIVRAAD